MRGFKNDSDKSFLLRHEIDNKYYVDTIDSVWRISESEIKDLKETVWFWWVHLVLTITISLLILRILYKCCSGCSCCVPPPGQHSTLFTRSIQRTMPRTGGRVLVPADFNELILIRSDTLSPAVGLNHFGNFPRRDQPIEVPPERWHSFNHVVLDLNMSAAQALTARSSLFVDVTVPLLSRQLGTSGISAARITPDDPPPPYESLQPPAYETIVN